MRGPLARFLTATFTTIVLFKSVSADRTLEINGDYAPGTLPQIDADGVTVKWITPGSLGGGTVSAVSLDATATPILSISTPSTTPTISFDPQSAALILAGPASGGPAAPTFRGLVATDIPALDAAAIGSGTFNAARLPIGTTAGTVAAGNDSRFHAQGTDTGTTSPTFQLGTGAGGALLKTNAGALEARNGADTAYADMVVRNLIVQGTTTTVNSEIVDIADSVLNLNSNFAGATPTENGGIEIERGTQTNAALIWNEGTDRWQAGLAGAEIDLPRQRKFTFNNAALTAGSIAITHGLENQYPDYRVYDNTNKPVEPADIDPNSTTVMTFNFNGVTVAGTWTIVITG
jgi:hypothetical protein